MAGKHDRRYKKLFSNPTLFKELFESFVNEDFVGELDFTTLERMDKSFVSDQFKEKESDLIYKILFKGKPLYLYVLLEFQSTVDSFMAIRILRYEMEFYEYLVQKENLKTLPAIFPLLLYNGDREWNSPVKIEELIEHTIPKKYIPSFEYYKIAENDFPKEVLLKIKNAVAAIFFVENSSPEELKKEIGNLISLLKEESIEVIRLFAAWLNNFLEKQDEKDRQDIADKIDNLMEVKTMFQTSLDQYAEKHEQIGIEKGIEKGIEQGKQQQEITDKQEILIKQMDKKFGLKDAEKEALRKVSDTSLLDNALDMILFVQTKEEILSRILP